MDKRLTSVTSSYNKSDEQSSSPTSQPRGRRTSRGVNNLAKVYHDRLCGVLVEGAALALRHVFNGIHPPVTLAEKLGKHDTRLRLKRLQTIKVLDENDWHTLYPKQKRQVTSDNYNISVVYVLLRSICHLTAPYPHGWNENPTTEDTGLSANIARLSSYRKLLVETDSLPTGECAEHLTSLCDLLTEVGSPTIKDKLDNLLGQAFTEERSEKQKEILKRWHENAERLDNMEANTNMDYQTRVNKNSTTLPKIGQPKNQIMQNNQNSDPSSPTENQTEMFPPVYEATAEEKAILVKHQKAIVESVRSEVVVGKLVKASILTHEDKISINLGTRNTDRMKNLIQILTTKNSHALDVFCEALKFKYPALYETLTKARVLAAQRPDETTECRDDLKNGYTAKFSQYSPALWHPEHKTDLKDFFTPLAITDFHGKAIKPENLFSQPGQRVILEGSSGVGKTTLAAYMTYLWATGEDSSVHRLAFLIDLGQVYTNVKNPNTRTLEDIIITQCISPGLGKTTKQVSNILSSIQAEIIFILDGYDKYSPKEKDGVVDLLNRQIYEKSSILLLGQGPYNNHPLRREFDGCCRIMGLEKGMQSELIDKYTKLTKTKEGTYYPLLRRLSRDNLSMLQTLCTQPLYCMYMCLLCELHQELTFETLGQLLESTLEVLQTNYSRKEQKNNTQTRPTILKIFDAKQKQMKATQIIVQLSEHALTSALNGVHQLDFEGKSLISVLTSNFNETLPFGIGIISPPVRLYKAVTVFHNTVFRDFMAAYALHRNTNESESEQILDVILQKPHLDQVLAIYCGLTNKEDHKQKIIDNLDDKNKAIQKTLLLPESSQPVLNSHEDGNKLFSVQTFCRLRDVTTSLECIAQRKGDESLVTSLSTSLPSLLYMKSRDIPSSWSIRGLASVVSNEAQQSVTHLSLHLDHFAVYNTNDYLVLAENIKKSKYLTNIKFTWTRANILAMMLAGIFKENGSIHTVTCVDRGKAKQPISAQTWADFQRASASMNNVETFNFHQCDNTQAIACVLRHLPPTITVLNLQGCIIDTVSAQELAKRLERSHLEKLDLSSTSWHKMDFVSLSNGIRLSRSIRHLNLIRLNLEGSFCALAEAIKFNKSLRHLDLQYSPMNDEMCTSLAESLPINDSLKIIVLTGTNITVHSEMVIKAMKKHQTKLIGLPKRKHNEIETAIQDACIKLPVIINKPIY